MADLTNDCIGWWKLEDNAASTAVIDNSISANDGVSQQDTDQITAAGKVDRSLEFNGSSDYITIADGNEYGANVDYSFFCWIKPDDTSSRFIFSKGDGANDGWEFFLDGSSKLVFEYQAVTTTSSTAAVPGAWFFVGVTVDVSGNAQIYFNGLPDGSPGNISGETLSIASTNTRIGALDYSVATTPFDGRIDNVMFFDKVLSTDEILRLYDHGRGVDQIAEQKFNLDDFLVMQLKCEDNAANTNVVDSSAFANTGTATANTSTMSTTGKLGDAFDLDNGVPDYILVPDADWYEQEKEITVAFWWKPDITDTSDCVVAKWGGATGWTMSYDNVIGGALRWIIQNGSLRTVTSGVLTAGSWWFVVGTYDGHYLRLYINGSSVGTPVATTANILLNSNDVSVGAYDGGTQPSDGTIDDVRIYDRALTPDEITYWYNSNNGRDGTNNGLPEVDLRGVVEDRWTCDDNAADTDVLSTGIAVNDGTFNDAGGDPNTDTHDAVGKINGALIFDGVDDYVDMGDLASYADWGEIAISAWVWIDSGGSGLDVVISSYQSFVVYFDHSTNKIGWVTDSDSWGGFWAPDTISENAWHHVAAIYDGIRMTLWVDGVFQKDARYALSNIDDGGNLYIGVMDVAGLNDFFTGKIDDVIVFDRAITGNEVGFLWNAGAGREELVAADIVALDNVTGANLIDLVLNQEQFNPSFLVQQGNIIRSTLACSTTPVQVVFSGGSGNLITLDGGTEELVIGAVAKSGIYANRKICLCATFAIGTSFPPVFYEFTWALNSVIDLTSKQSRVVTANDIGNITIPAKMVVTDGDRISLWVNTQVKSANLTIRDFNVAVMGLIEDES